ncbi:AAA family ATPase [Rhodoferax sp. U11-2br]|nr:AAA family ATPase [Rhodoferax sp. U11-2br]
MNPKLPPFIQALLAPQAYPGEVKRVELVETHISWVLLAGEFAYKIKKPVKLAFLDFSTLALRQQACLDELRLNRRLAPDIYLDVVCLNNSPHGPQWGGTGQVLDYAVRMRRFDEAGRLDHVCERGELRPVHLSDLAGSLVAFHETAAFAAPDTRFGVPDQVMAPMLDNFTDLSTMLKPPPDADALARLACLQTWTQAQFKQLAPLMHARKSGGRVRECHGDLHLANLVLINGAVRLFDCLEFNEDLRWIDVASDIAFPYIDLLEHGQPGLANWLLNEVLSHSGDYQGSLLLRFYAVYRCLVRAKVAAIRAKQLHAYTSEVQADISLAERLAAPHPVQLTVTHGLSGCGKTYLTDQWLQQNNHAPTLRLRADVERKRLFKLGRLAQSNSGINAGIYAPEVHAQVYAHLRELPASLLAAGWSVIVDASFLKRADRDVFRALAAEQNARFAILAPQASPEQLRARILARNAAGTDASEATLAVLAHQQHELESLTDDERVFVL